MNVDLTNWTPIECAEADALLEPADLTVSGGFTDVLGEFGDLLSYREWERDGAPVLREFRYRGDLGCSHYAPIGGAS